MLRSDPATKKLSEDLSRRYRCSIIFQSQNPSTPPSSNVDKISDGVRIIRRIGDVVIAATHTKATVGGATVFNHKNHEWINKGRLLAIYSGNGRHFIEDIISFEDLSLEGAARLQVKNNKSTVTKLDLTSPYFMGGCKEIAEGLYQDIAGRLTDEPDVVKNAKLIMKQTLCEIAKVDEETGGYISVSDSRMKKSGIQWVETGIQLFEWPARDWQHGTYGSNIRVDPKA